MYKVINIFQTTLIFDYVCNVIQTVNKLNYENLIIAIFLHKNFIIHQTIANVHVAKHELYFLSLKRNMSSQREKYVIFKW